MTISPLPPSPEASARQAHEPVAPWWHTAVFVAIVLGFSFYQGRPQLVARVSQLPSRMPVYIATLIMELALFGFAWFGLRLRRVPIRSVIAEKWTAQEIAIDIAAVVIFWMVVLAVIVPLEYALGFRGIEAAKPLLPQSVREVVAFVALAVVAGFCEEFIFRGYLQRQFLALTKLAWPAVALQAIVFGAAHFYQGWRAMIAITVYGALFGILTAIRKSLRPGMIQHAAQDSLAGVAGYLAAKYKLI